MVELLGFLLAILIVGLIWGLWRLFRAAIALLSPCASLRATPLRLARRRLRRADAHAAAQAAEIRRLRLALRMHHRRCTLSSDGDRFEQTKRAFALRFHPDHAGTSEPERSLRIAMFKEFWAELRRIERG
jgi:hypothetical protein